MPALWQWSMKYEIGPSRQDLVRVGYARNRISRNPESWNLNLYTTVQRSVRREVLRTKLGHRRYFLQLPRNAKFEGRQMMHHDSGCKTGSDRRTSASAALAAILTFAMVFLFAGHAVAQLDTAVINGTVRDQSGAVIPGAAIEVRNRDTGLLRTTTTNGNGGLSR